MSSLRVVLVDDHEVVRMGLRLLLDGMADTEVVAEAGSAAEAVAACERYQPHVVIMDIRMPEVSGVDACRTIVGRWPEIQVIMLTSYADDALIADAIHAGAVGYVLKQGSTDELKRALDAIRRGEASLDPTITRRVLAIMRQHDEKEVDLFSELTEREVAVLILLAQGKTNNEIAAELFLSEKTVRNHVSAVLSKLNVENRVEAATLAVSHNIQTYQRPK